MIAVAVEVDAAGFVEWLKKASTDLQSGARQALGQSVAFALRQAKSSRAFEDRTGALRNSIVRGQTGPWVHFIRAGNSRVKYAKFVEGGTKAHPIEARRAKVLRFVQAGQVRFAKRVEHHGTFPANYMRDASREGAVALLDSVERAVNRALL